MVVWVEVVSAAPGNAAEASASAKVVAVFFDRVIRKNFCGLRSQPLS
jgi:hypothetical protein